MTKYQRVVEAALAETTSKFRLAEALALDIPPRRSGPADDEGLLGYLADARQAIITAGGEPRAVETLRHYRQTALWVKGDLTPNFQWLPGVSFSAHEEARRFGMSYAEFADLPSKTVDVVRKVTGHAGTDGSPSSIVSGWTREQKTEAAKELIKTPGVADEVARDYAARSHMQEAASRESERQHELQRNVPPFGGGSGREGITNPLDLLWEFRQLHRTIDRIAAEVSKRGSIVGEEERAALVEEVVWLQNALTMIGEGIQGGSVDEALARLLEG